MPAPLEIPENDIVFDGETAVSDLVVAEMFAGLESKALAADPQSTDDSDASSEEKIRKSPEELAAHFDVPAGMEEDSSDDDEDFVSSYLDSICKQHGVILEDGAVSDDDMGAGPAGLVNLGLQEQAGEEGKASSSGGGTTTAPSSEKAAETAKLLAKEKSEKAAKESAEMLQSMGKSAFGASAKKLRGEELKRLEIVGEMWSVVQTQNMATVRSGYDQKAVDLGTALYFKTGDPFGVVMDVLGRRREGVWALHDKLTLWLSTTVKHYYSRARRISTSFTIVNGHLRTMLKGCMDLFLLSSEEEDVLFFGTKITRCFLCHGVVLDSPRGHKPIISSSVPPRAHPPAVVSGASVWAGSRCENRH